jgi:hypothetical protein
MAEDPAVRAGRFDVQVLPWHVPAGALTGGRGRLPRSIADVRSDG